MNPADQVRFRMLWASDAPLEWRWNNMHNKSPWQSLDKAGHGWKNWEDSFKVPGWEVRKAPGHD